MRARGGLPRGGGQRHHRLAALAHPQRRRLTTCEEVIIWDGGFTCSVKETITASNYSSKALSKQWTTYCTVRF